ncbi:MAG: ribosome biogenesis GTP-binding protein YihA/YsxC [Candidatus Binataceae bacterium]
MNRFSAEFAMSAQTLAGCPRWDRIEAAIAGRSNVGKSSLLNALAGTKQLARTSKTPGRTRSLNFFTVGESLALCDLPGYGYAKLPHDEARRIAAMMRDYLERRRELAALAILVDARRGPESEELELAALAARRGLQLIAIATKCDKLRRSERAAAIARFAPMGAAPIMCSAVSGEGIEAVRRILLALANSPIRPADNG